MRTPDPQMRERRRGELLDAAAVCFARTGFAGTRSADITGHAGLSSGSLYYYFPSKQAVLMALIERETVAVSEVGVPATRDAARGTMAALLGEACRQAEDPVARGLALEIAALSLRDPEVEAHARKSDAALRELLGALAAAGKSTVAADTAGTWLAAIIDGLFTRSAVQTGFSAAAEADNLRTLVDSFLGWR